MFSSRKKKWVRIIPSGFSFPRLAPTQTARPFACSTEKETNWILITPLVGITAHVNDTFYNATTLWSLVRGHDAPAVPVAEIERSVIRAKYDTRHDSLDLMRPYKSCQATHVYTCKAHRKTIYMPTDCLSSCQRWITHTQMPGTIWSWCVHSGLFFANISFS